MILLAFFCGALNVLAFAPFALWPLQIATLAVIFHLGLRTTSIKRAALIGVAYGFGWIVCGMYWLFISLHTYGDLPAWLAALAVALLALVLASFYAAALATSAWLSQRTSFSNTIALLAIFPAAWMLFEWLRGWLFTGLPWIASGYAHTSAPLAGFAPLVGVYGIGWIAAIIAGTLALLPMRKLPMLIAIALLATGVGLKQIEWTHAFGKPISVRLLQGNVPQSIKFDGEHLASTLAMYQAEIEAAPADLIATPETALPLFDFQLPEGYLAQLASYAQTSHSYLAIGIPVSERRGHYANSLIGIAPQTPTAAPTVAYQYRYDKHHLVPFGEFIPFGFHWFVTMMNIPLGDFSSAPIVQPPFAVKDQWVQPNICYEDLFGGEIAQQLRASDQAGKLPATVLLNISNIAWFGDSIALPQHLQISQMRALETGRPMLRATNTGVTAVIQANGNVSAQLPPLTRNVLSASVQGRAGLTPYVRYGNAPAVILAMLILLAAMIFNVRKARTTHDSSKTR